MSKNRCEKELEKFCLRESLQNVTPRMKEMLRHSFGQMKHDDKGTEIFLRLFQDFPQYKEMFPTLKVINDEFLMMTPEVAMHAKVFMTALEDIVNSLDDDAHLEREIRKISKSHFRKGVTYAHVTNMLPKVLYVSKLCNNGKLDPEVELAWNTLFTVIADCVEQYKHDQAHPH